ncbi:cell division protein DedD [Enterobacteriaceae bacterium LUAb1]
MASKFQNRLAGTVILVALGIIILPGLLDGQKKHYKEEFAAIPLVPNKDDEQDADLLPSVTQPLPAQPLPGENAGLDAKTRQTHQEEQVLQSSHRSDVQQPLSDETAPVSSHITSQTSSKQPPVSPPVQSVTPRDLAKKLSEKPKSNTKTENKPAPDQKAAESPAGKAYVVQLGALKNAAKVNEVVAQLRLSGYRAWSVPSTPVQGELTRIYVGPDASKTKMQSAVSELKGISGLRGVVKPWTVR